MGLFGGKKEKYPIFSDIPDEDSDVLELSKSMEESDSTEIPSYSIEQAIQLMRALPVDQNVELVVQVIKTTLESLQVKVPDIIGSAKEKLSSLEERIAFLKEEISDLQNEIQNRQQEITQLEASHQETTQVKAHLELAENISEQETKDSPQESQNNVILDPRLKESHPTPRYLSLPKNKSQSETPDNSN